MRLFLLGLSLISPLLLAEPNPERQADIRNLLKHDCGSCHGLTLKGGLGPSLLAADLRYKTTDFLIDTIQNGRQGTAMPPWKPFINEAETRWLIHTLLR